MHRTWVNFNGINGEYPVAGLIADAAGDLFGTTANGRANGDDTAFEIAKTGGSYASAPTTLANLDGTNGSYPERGLIAAAGDLFGTTSSGGVTGDGTVFEITTTAVSSPPPTLRGAGATVSYTSGDAAVAVDAGRTVTDTSEARLIGARVSISSGLLAGDTLTFTSEFGIASTHNSASSVLALSGAASLADYQAALDSVTYKSSSADRTNSGADTSRTITWTVSDVEGTSAPVTSTIGVQPAPITVAPVVAAYQAILRVTPSRGAAGTYVMSIAAQINSGTTTFSNYEGSLIVSDQALYTTLPAPVTVDAYYETTPQSSTLTAVAESTGSPAQIGGFYSAAYLHSLGYSEPNVWTITASHWGADQHSAFCQLYSSYGSDYSDFISAVDQRELGFAPSAVNLQTLVNDVPGMANSRPSFSQPLAAPR